MITDFRHQRDPVGRVIQREELDAKVRYQYDGRGLLTHEAWSDATGSELRTIRYAYDAEGNRVRMQDSREGTTTYAYDADDRMVELQEDGVRFDYVYDLAGSLSEVRGDGQIVVYEWDGLERLVRAAATTGGDVQWQETYAYNARRERVGVVRDGEEVRYLVDANREYRVPIAAYGSDGNPTHIHVHGHHQISTSTNAGDQIFLTGNNASVRVVTDATGAVVQTVSYDAFGEIAEFSGGTFASSLFNNEPRSQATGLDYLRARYYDPSIGRFLSMDEYDGEVEQPLSRNRYLYAWSDPVNMTDPSGEQTLVETLVTAGMITTGAAGGAILGHGLFVASWQAQGHHASTLPKDGSYYFVVGSFAIIGGVAGGAAAWGILSSGGPTAGGIAIEEAAAQGLISQGVAETAAI